jgi:uncharacterized protein YjeT (DUF2065 family)
MVLLALGLVLIVEGLVYLLAPGAVERMLEALRDLPVPARRQIGGLAVVSGLILLWVADRLGGLPFG